MMYFTQMCQKVFFPTEDYSAAVFGLVNGGLAHLFEERMMLDQLLPTHEYNHFASLTRSNFERTLTAFPLSVQSTLENAQLFALAVC